MNARPGQWLPPTPVASWVAYKDPAGRDYLHNPATGETRWLWSVHVDPATGRRYAANTLTGERRWLAAAPDQPHPHPHPHSNGAVPSHHDRPHHPAVASPQHNAFPRRAGPQAMGSSASTPSSAAAVAAAPAAAEEPGKHAAAPVESAAAGTTAAPAGRGRVEEARRAKAAATLLQRLARGRTVRTVGLVPALRELRRRVGRVEDAAGSRIQGPVGLDGIQAELEGALRRRDSEAVTKLRNQLKGIGELITQGMLAVDGVDSGGDERIRRARKDAIRRLQVLEERETQIMQEVDKAFSELSTTA